MRSQEQELIQGKGPGWATESMETRGKANTRMGTGQSVGQDKESARRILLIVERCGAGEAVRVMPYVTLVRELFPHAHIALLANEDAAAVFAPGEVFDRVVISRLLSAMQSNLRGCSHVNSDHSTGIHPIPGSTSPCYVPLGALWMSR